MSASSNPRPRSSSRPRRWASTPVAAEYIGVNPATIRAMIADGRITGYRSSSRLIRVDLNEIDACMKPYGGAA